MAIQSISTSTQPYPSTSAAKSKSTTSMETPPQAQTAQPSIVVTLSDGTVSEVTERSSETLKSMQLSVAWAPQMLVQADTNQDEQLDSDEFRKQLDRVGVTEQDVRKLFKGFDTSGDGSLTVDEFVKGIKNSLAQGEAVFDDLVNSYQRDSAGNIDDAATDAFLKQGYALALKYQIQQGGRS